MKYLVLKKKMNNTGILCYILITCLWNCEVTYAALCLGVNGTSCCLGYHWDEIQKSCIPCKVGYFGQNCDTKCIYPSYGNDCQSACNCTDTDCDYVEGCINSTRKTIANICNGKNGTICCNGYKWNKEETKCIPCEKGYTGLNCENFCLFPTYGLDCQLICTCTEGTCDPVDGCREYSTEFPNSKY